MQVNSSEVNIAIISLFENRHQIITLDTNILLPPFRNNVIGKGYNFTQYKQVFLDPIFSCFPLLAIHEAVRLEIVEESISNYIAERISSSPQQLLVHDDNALSPIESAIRSTYEHKIAPYTRYLPQNDNSSDRGEVKSLAYIATRSLLYFSANDQGAIDLVKKAYEYNTGLDNVQIIQMYEIIYFLCKTGFGNQDDLKYLYKYLYYLTENEKRNNPSWGDFLSNMQLLYRDCTSHA